MALPALPTRLHYYYKHTGSASRGVLPRAAVLRRAGTRGRLFGARLWACVGGAQSLLRVLAMTALARTMDRDLRATRGAVLSMCLSYSAITSCEVAGGRRRHKGGGGSPDGARLRAEARSR